MLQTGFETGALITVFYFIPFEYLLCARIFFFLKITQQGRYYIPHPTDASKAQRGPMTLPGSHEYRHFQSV